jgi:chromosome segregation ATPase
VRDYIANGKLDAKPEGEGVERRWLVSIDSVHALRQARQSAARSPRDRHEVPRGGELAAEIAADLMMRVQDLQYKLGRAEARAEITERAESTIREERNRLIDDLERERQRANQERARTQRLEARTAEATELRIRLELTEKAQSTLEGELDGERRRREETEAERDELRRELDEWRRLEESAETTAHEIHDRREEQRGHEDTPPEPSESPESLSPSDTPTEASAEAQEATERRPRSFWRRIFGG